MNTYIALLRGINVGGHKKVPMAVLRDVLSKIRLEHVKTYIQSGNVIFQSQENDPKILEATISKAIFDKFGFEVPILIRTPKQIKSVLNECPFPSEKMEKSYFILFNEVPKKNWQMKYQQYNTKMKNSLFKRISCIFILRQVMAEPNSI